MPTIHPAHTTKNTTHMHYPLPPPLTSTVLSLTQDSTNGTTTASTLWLGAQVLTIYLYTLYPPRTRTPPPRALDLGAGIGLTSLALAAAGWHVTATDITTTVLAQNIAANALLLPSKSIAVQSLDWHSPGGGDPYDLIVSSDTLYDTALTGPLLRTIRSFCGPKTTVLLAVEVRDRQVIDGALEGARAMGFEVRKVPGTRLGKCLVAAGVKWEREEWVGVEVWRLRLKGDRKIT